MRLSVRLLTCLALALAACGSDGSDDDADPAEDGEVSEEGTEELSDEELGEIAADAVLVLEDLPTGWDEAPPDDEEDEEVDEELEDAIGECTGLSQEELDEEDPKAESTFVDESDAEVSSEVAVVDTEEEAHEELELYRDEEIVGCVTDAIEVALTEEVGASGVELGEITSELLPVDHIGDGAGGFRLTVPLSQAGMTFEAYLDFMGARIGRVTVSHSYFSFGSPFDDELAQELLATVVDRVPEDV